MTRVGKFGNFLHPGRCTDQYFITFYLQLCFVVAMTISVVTLNYLTSSLLGFPKVNI